MEKDLKNIDDLKNKEESTFINTKSIIFLGDKKLKLKNLKNDLQKKKDLLFLLRKKKSLNEPNLLLKKISNLVTKMINLKNIKNLENAEIFDKFEENIFQKKIFKKNWKKIDKIMESNISLLTKQIKYGKK